MNPGQQEIRGRVALAVFYAMYGLIFATWASRIPDIKAALNLNEALLGTLLFFIPAGQMCTMMLSGFLVSRFGSTKVILCGTALYPLILVLLGRAGTPVQLAAGLFLFGMAANLLNISVNTQAVALEHYYNKNMMSSFNGFWSLGGLLGGILSTVFVVIHIIPFFHFLIILALALIVILAFNRFLLRQDFKQEETPVPRPKRKLFSRPDRYILMFGLIAFGAMACEGTMFDWSSVYFEEVIHPAQHLIRLGYIASMVSMTGGRFIADWCIARCGVTLVLKVCGITIAGGLMLATLFPSLLPATAGFFFVGIGVSAVVPIAFSMAGKSKAMVPGIAIATVSSIGFLGFLLGPPLIGFIAHSTNLRVALGLIAIVGVAISFLAFRIEARTR
ncbi:putative Inner membrane protein YbjJ [Pillotina sp. SPG140]|jgi:MFS family permease